jgi:hypothetical protein
MFFLSSKMDEKLIELVRKCEELYDMSDKKHSDNVWKEKYPHTQNVHTDSGTPTKPQKGTGVLIHG